MIPLWSPIKLFVSLKLAAKSAGIRENNERCGGGPQKSSSPRTTCHFEFQLPMSCSRKSLPCYCSPKSGLFCLTGQKVMAKPSAGSSTQKMAFEGLLAGVPTGVRSSSNDTRRTFSANITGVERSRKATNFWLNRIINHPTFFNHLEFP